MATNEPIPTITEPLDTTSTTNGLKFERYFTSKIYEQSGTPYTMNRDGSPLEWDLRTARITNDKGKVIFEQKDVRVPKSWSQTATDMVASKYFTGQTNSPKREKCVGGLVARVVDTIANWGLEDGYFASGEEAESFRAELSFIIFNQLATPNSPVWFNVGLFHKLNIQSGGGGEHFRWNKETSQVVGLEPDEDYKFPQVSACFIQGVYDNMSSIMDLAKSEAMLFKYGSGSGTNLSTLRSSKEPLSNGGHSSGPVAFMKGYDAFAGIIKSGGKTRRAAKMQILNVEHPDIELFVEAKPKEEKKAQALIAAGYDPSMNGEAYTSIAFQNANLSVRVTNEFMKAALERRTFHTKFVKTGELYGEKDARALLRKIAEAAHVCGDPGLQFDTIINDWHTCPNTGRIHASNPCSEYMFLDDSACNLASLNLMRFRNPNGSFNIEDFKRTVRTMIIAQEILVDSASYPTQKIAENSHNFRPLGLGYANLGALLMSEGLAYDSDEARATAAYITALMHTQANVTSAEIASVKGAFEGFKVNQEPMLKVMRKHRDAAYAIDSSKVPHRLENLVTEAKKSADLAVELGEKQGYRNAQVTVLAPTGTIAFMMDCDTTGIEPDIALIKHKLLSGEGDGRIKIVNQTVPLALTNLEYNKPQIKEILDYLNEKETIEGAPHLKDDHLPIFDCAFKPKNGQRFIQPIGHIRMMAACQPFLSGAISKTVNMPESATVEEIEQIYMEAWKLGLKAIAIYRDNCKGSQPLSTSFKPRLETKVLSIHDEFEGTVVELPQTRQSLTHHFRIGDRPSRQADLSGYFTATIHEGNAEELFITMAKQGSTLAGFATALGIAVATDLRHGVPLDVLVDKFKSMKFEPNGKANNPNFEETPSVVAYIFRELEHMFLKDKERTGLTDLRKRLPRTRNAIVHKFEVGANEGYLTVGLYDDGKPGEIFLGMGQEGSTLAGFIDSLAIAVSIGLQYSIPLFDFAKNFVGMQFEPSALVFGRLKTDDTLIKTAKSIPDYVFRWLGHRFINGFEEWEKSSAMTEVELTDRLQTSPEKKKVISRTSSDNPLCSNCGSIMVCSGSCHRCLNCGDTSGCG